MPEPEAHPEYRRIRRTCVFALIAGIVLTGVKFFIYYMTNAAVVLTDAAESIANVIAAGFVLYSVWLSNRPADDEHPYGHGKVEFLAAGFEGTLIGLAGIAIGIAACQRMIEPQDLTRLSAGIWSLAGMAVVTMLLASYVYRTGKQTACLPLIADGKHLFTDAASTIGAVIALLLVKWSGQQWIDAAAALMMAALILRTSWQLIWEAIHGLMDHTDPEDDLLIRQILDKEVSEGHISSYHKVRHRHTGSFHWVDLHIQVDPDITVTEGHDIASAIERQIEVRLGDANATAHIEPDEPVTDNSSEDSHDVKPAN